MYTLGRLEEFHPKSKEFPIRALIGESLKPRSYTWTCGVTLDQGSESSCVGNAFIHELIAKPNVAEDLTEADAYKVYKTAQDLDQWPGNSYQGTSVLAGIKAIQKLYPDAIKEYRWGFGLQDLIDTLSYHGPCVLGVNWYAGMFKPDVNQTIHVIGSKQGGHAILANGVNVKKELIRLHNSWGPKWGINGECFISYKDMERLLKEKGEVCVPVKRGKASKSVH